LALRKTPGSIGGGGLKHGTWQQDDSLDYEKERTEMTSIEHLIQQNILERESRLKHIDEFIERARNKIVKDPEHAEIRDSLASMTQERDKYYSWIDELRLKHLENWRVDEIEKAGPMGIWDAVAQQLEKLVERIER
jgi:hypothetical protein